MRQGKSMTARELQDILNLLPPGAKDVVVSSTRDCKISASVPSCLPRRTRNGPAWAQFSIVWQFVNQASYAKEPGFTRVIYCGPRSEGK